MVTKNSLLLNFTAGQRRPLKSSIDSLDDQFGSTADIRPILSMDPLSCTSSELDISLTSDQLLSHPLTARSVSVERTEKPAISPLSNSCDATLMRSQLVPPPRRRRLQVTHSLMSSALYPSDCSSVSQLSADHDSTAFLMEQSESKSPHNSVNIFPRRSSYDSLTLINSNSYEKSVDTKNSIVDNTNKNCNILAEDKVYYKSAMSEDDLCKPDLLIQPTDVGRVVSSAASVTTDAVDSGVTLSSEEEFIGDHGDLKLSFKKHLSVIEQKSTDSGFYSIVERSPVDLCESGHISPLLHFSENLALPRSTATNEQQMNQQKHQSSDEFCLLENEPNASSNLVDNSSVPIIMNSRYCTVASDASTDVNRRVLRKGMFLTGADIFPSKLKRMSYCGDNTTSSLIASIADDVLTKLDSSSCAAVKEPTDYTSGNNCVVPVSSGDVVIEYDQVTQALSSSDIAVKDHVVPLSSSNLEAEKERGSSLPPSYEQAVKYSKTRGMFFDDFANKESCPNEDNYLQQMMTTCERIQQSHCVEHPSTNTSASDNWTVPSVEIKTTLTTQAIKNLNGLHLNKNNNDISPTSPLVPSCNSMMPRYSLGTAHSDNSVVGLNTEMPILKNQHFNFNKTNEHVTYSKGLSTRELVQEPGALMNQRSYYDDTNQPGHILPNQQNYGLQNQYSYSLHNRKWHQELAEEYSKPHNAYSALAVKTVNSTNSTLPFATASTTTNLQNKKADFKLVKAASVTSRDKELFADSPAENRALCELPVEKHAAGLLRESRNQQSAALLQAKRASLPINPNRFENCTTLQGDSNNVTFLDKTKFSESESSTVSPSVSDLRRMYDNSLSNNPSAAVSHRQSDSFASYNSDAASGHLGQAQQQQYSNRRSQYNRVSYI